MNREQETQAALQAKLAELVNAPIKEDIADFCRWIAADAKEYFGLPKDDERIGEFICALPIEHTDCIQFADDVAVLGALQLPDADADDAEKERRINCLFAWVDSTKLGKMTFDFVQLYQIRPHHYPAFTSEQIQDSRPYILLRHWRFCAQLLTAFAFVSAARDEYKDSMGLMIERNKPADNWVWYSEKRALRLLSKGYQWLMKARLILSNEMHVGAAVEHGFTAAETIQTTQLSQQRSKAGKQPRKKSVLKALVQGAFHREKEQGNQFKITLNNWLTSPPEGLTVAKVSGSSGQYDFTDDETGESKAYEYSTLKTMYSTKQTKS